jgi:hypothetical protein
VFSIGPPAMFARPVLPALPVGRLERIRGRLLSIRPDQLPEERFSLFSGSFVHDTVLSSTFERSYGISRHKSKVLFNISVVRPDCVSGRVRRLGAHSLTAPLKITCILTASGVSN